MWYGWAFRTLRGYAPYVVLPFAAVIGYLGYKLEGAVSTKYTPYKEPIKEARNERQISEDSLQSAAEVEKLKYSANVLGKNVSPSLQ